MFEQVRKCLGSHELLKLDQEAALKSLGYGPQRAEEAANAPAVVHRVVAEDSVPSLSMVGEERREVTALTVPLLE